MELLKSCADSLKVLAAANNRQYYGAGRGGRDHHVEPDQFFAALKQCGANLEELRLDGNFDLRPDNWDPIAKQMTKCTRLSLSGCVIDPSVRWPRRLRHLRIGNIGVSKLSYGSTTTASTPLRLPKTLRSLTTSGDIWYQLHVSPKLKSICLLSIYYYPVDLILNHLKGGGEIVIVDGVINDPRHYYPSSGEKDYLTETEVLRIRIFNGVRIIVLENQNHAWIQMKLDDYFYVKDRKDTNESDRGNKEEENK